MQRPQGGSVLSLLHVVSFGGLLSALPVLLLSFVIIYVANDIDDDDDDDDDDEVTVLTTQSFTKLLVDLGCRVVRENTYVFLSPPRGGSRGRVQGVYTPTPQMWLLGVHF